MPGCRAQHDKCAFALNSFVCLFADTLLPILTVEEMLMYTAELKWPRSIALADKQQAVEELLDKLALQDCR